MTCCKTSFNLCDPVPACIKQLIIKTPIISDSVILRFLDRFGKVYYIAKTTDDSGLATIQIQDNGILAKDLPIALLNEYAGTFYVMLFNGLAAQVKWTISGVQYDAIGLNVANITPVVDTFTIDPTIIPGILGSFSF